MDFRGRSVWALWALAACGAILTVAGTIEAIQKPGVMTILRLVYALAIFLWAAHQARKTIRLQRATRADAREPRLSQ